MTTTRNQTAKHIALLAPVPLQHLVSGQLVAATEGRVAFGSRRFQVFRDLDVHRQGLPVDVYLYASHADGVLVCDASWQAIYLGHVEAVYGGAHPAGMRYRPPTTAQYVKDSRGKWAIFWEVAQLRELPPGAHLRVANLTPFGKRRPYGSPFVPEGPILIAHP